jgi:hypothetical protein
MQFCQKRKTWRILELHRCHTIQVDGVHHPLNFLRSIVINVAFDGCEQSDHLDELNWIQVAGGWVIYWDGPLIPGEVENFQAVEARDSLIPFISRWTCAGDQQTNPHCR